MRSGTASYHGRRYTQPELGLFRCWDLVANTPITGGRLIGLGRFKLASSSFVVKITEPPEDIQVAEALQCLQCRNDLGIRPEVSGYMVAKTTLQFAYFLH